MWDFFLYLLITVDVFNAVFVKIDILAVFRCHFIYESCLESVEMTLNKYLEFKKKKYLEKIEIDKIF